MRQLIHAAAVALAIFGSACEANRAPASDHNIRIASADLFTKKYAQSPLSGWRMRGRAVGSDCDILFVETSIILEDSMIDALQHGNGAYNVHPRGIERFANDHSFRGIAYKDASGRVWTFGRVASTEALMPCH
jgi:hypothetical protein